MSPGGPLILVTGASEALAGHLFERTRGQGIAILAVSGRPPQHTWPHVTWIEHDLQLGPADVRCSTLVSLGRLVQAVHQVESMSGIGRVVAVSSALVNRLSLLTSPVGRTDLRRLEGHERRLRELCRERRIALTLLRPTLTWSNRFGPGFRAMSDHLAGRRWLALGRGGLRQPVHADDLARLIVDCLARGATTGGCWNLAGGEALTVAALVERVVEAAQVDLRRVPVPAFLSRRTLEAMQLPEPMQLELASLFRHDLLPDDQPARERLGWHPRGFRP